MRNICLKTFRNDRICSKVVYFLNKIQASRVNNFENRPVAVFTFRCVWYACAYNWQAIQTNSEASWEHPLALSSSLDNQIKTMYALFIL